VYTPRPFAIDDDEARRLLADVEVAQLVTATESGPLATLMPWIVDLENDRLLGHVARPNRQWQTPWTGYALVLWSGVDGYVSPSWYASKAEHGRVVPTWDYVVLQVFGELVVHDDPAWCDDVVRRLTDRHEQRREAPWSVDDAPADYLEGHLRGIVGIEVTIARIEVSVKMSQNKSEADISGVVDGFTADGRTDIADLVRRSSS
jgi:transcriptional regulator